MRRWVLEASCSPEGPWTIISSHPEDDTYFYDVTDGQNKENSFLYGMGSRSSLVRTAGRSRLLMGRATFTPTSASSRCTPIRMVARTLCILVGLNYTASSDGTADSMYYSDVFVMNVLCKDNLTMLLIPRILTTNRE